MQQNRETLTPQQAQTYYNWLGKKLDSQGFYENPALDVLVEEGDFGHAGQVFELGCGTGRVAERLLQEKLPASARYHGVDISPVMVEVASERLEPFGTRITVEHSGGNLHLPPDNASVDRVIATYVLDLLSEANIELAFAEAHRILAPGGLFCIASLTPGITLPSRLVTAVWKQLFRLHPAIVGGCRPVRLTDFVDPDFWIERCHRTVTPFGVPSEVLILEARTPQQASHPTNEPRP
ncbi:class I SAM-dependent methyltransferase [Marinobacteraceae bacterium S3BR75-40.1]